MKNVIRVYEKTGSIKQTVKKLHVCEQKCRKMLISKGQYSNDMSNTVGELISNGMSVPEISEHLGVSKSTVYSYSPYTKGMYKTDKPSKNALKIRKCRQNKKKPPQV